MAYQPGVALDDLQLILEKTPAEVWNALRGKHIFITGGTGFVGCWLLEALIWANQQLNLQLSITVLTRSPESFVRKAVHLATNEIIELQQGDVNNLQEFSENLDIVIHAATDVVNADTNYLAAYNAIVNGSIETLALAKRSKASHYLLTSSGAVYGRQPESIVEIPETYLGAPETTLANSAYGQAKRISEWLAHCSANESGLKVKVARCFALIGPYLPLDAHFAVGNFIRDGLDKKTINVSGDGTAYRSYLYAADMVVWLLTILINGQQGQQYNLGSSSALSIKDLAEKVSSIMHGHKDIALGSQPKEDTVAQRYVPDVTKAKNELGLGEYTNLETSIQKTIDWETLRRKMNPNNNG
jgi:nucleoside-diphosphate-sugar epimerase